MRQAVWGVLGGLALSGIGVIWWQGRAAIESGAPPPAAGTPAIDPQKLPLADPGNLKGPLPPELTERNREQQRFDRLERNRDGFISRNEMLSTRTEAFRKLDKDGNNLLTFEEWAVTTVDRFERADKDGDDRLTRAEFATTAPKPVGRKPACTC